MSTRRIRFMTFLGMVPLWLAAAAPAHANLPPGGTSLFTFWSIPLATALFTALGGGYAIMRRASAGRKLGRVKAVLVTLVYFFLMVAGMVSAGATALLTLVLGIGAIGRAVQLLRWGAQARRGGSRTPAEHLAGAHPSRLIAAGGALLLATLLLVAWTFDFVFSHSLDQSLVERDLARLTASTIALARIEGGDKGEARLPEVGTQVFERLVDWPREDPSDLRWLEGHWKRGNISLERSADGASFTIHVPPRATVIPYGSGLPRLFRRFVRFATWRADEKGAIRMKLTHRDERCPADAPVVRQVGEEEIRAETERLGKQPAAASDRAASATAKPEQRKE